MPAVDCRSGRGRGCCCLLMLPRQQTVRQRQSYRGGKHFSNLQLAYREHSTVRTVQNRGEGGERRLEVRQVQSRVENHSCMRTIHGSTHFHAKVAAWCPVQASYGFSSPVLQLASLPGGGEELFRNAAQNHARLTPCAYLQCNIYGST